VSETSIDQGTVELKKWDLVRYTKDHHTFLAKVRSLKPDRRGMVMITRDDTGRFLWAHKDNLELQGKEGAA
jgi:hypothetical protein